MSVAEYVILPSQGLRAGAETAGPARRFLTALVPGQHAALGGAAGRSAVTVLDSIGRDGARLVRGSWRAVAVLAAAQPGLRVVPVHYYRPASWRSTVVDRLATVRGATGSVDVIVRRRGDGAPVAGATVVALLDVAGERGAVATTNRSGRARLRLGGARVLDQVMVFADVGYWSLLRRDVVVSNPIELGMRPLPPDARDAVTAHFRPARPGDGARVRVGVVDTGIALDHPDLVVAGGYNAVTGEDPDDFGSNGDAHGTHVAGIIAARGRGPSGRSGLAPGVDLRSYRVFGRRTPSGASSFAIAKAIDAAVVDGCDLVNLSLGSAEADAVLRDAVAEARAAGTVVVAAAGNDDRGPVCHPAAEPISVAVSALGRKGTYPRDSAAIVDQFGPYGRDSRDYVARFSNVGPEIDLAAPGVAIVSTVPGGYGEMSGTSMACPVVVGLAARLVSRSPRLRNAPRDQARSDEVVRRLLGRARSLGFPVELEGRGLPT